MRIADLIYKKAQRGELSDEEVRFFISELVAGRVEDSQLGNIWLSIIVHFALMIDHRLQFAPLSPF